MIVSALDDEPPTLECRSFRKRLIDSFGVDMILYHAGASYVDLSPEDARAIDHAKGCNHCGAWLDRALTHGKLRQQRMARYCCGPMFAAVEEAVGDDFHLQPRRIADSLLWVVADERPLSGVTFFLFCPWCGKRLPEGPFINDDAGCVRKRPRDGGQQRSEGSPS